MVERELHDRAVAERIVDALETTLFVEAGAGAGKTTMLTRRVVALVLAGIPVTSVAAITFTEKAAAELRERVRERLHEMAGEVDDPVLGDRLRQALDDLDLAALGTLHAFCRRLLGEHPIEAPFRQVSPSSTRSARDMAFHDRWTEFSEALLDDPERGRLIVYAESYSGLHLDGLRGVANEFSDNWDLVADRVAAHGRAAGRHPHGRPRRRVARHRRFDESASRRRRRPVRRPTGAARRPVGAAPTSSRLRRCSARSGRRSGSGTRSSGRRRPRASTDC